MLGKPKKIPVASLSTALQDRDTNHPDFKHFWEVQQEQHISRLIQASRELGFELPRYRYQG